MNKNKAILIVLLVVAICIAGYFFTVDKKPSMQVLSPASGDVLTEGSVYVIKWKTKNIPATDKISITIRRVPPPPLQEEGQEFDPIVFINLPNTGSQDWTVSDMYPAGNYVIGVNSYASIPITDTVTAESGQFKIEKSSVVVPKKVVFACADSKSITASFYIGEDKFVDLELSDGRSMRVPRAISASGARYANTDETFVFWNKGDTAFITEGANSAQTYKNCQLK
ncbi:MAG: hypothetical protein AB201_02060 [Parcubacteria bacterium C7867-006]|nr:MAG: hypothetical protein AB201_02060 [Parcubacteria bacterium C7867-006]